MDSTPAPTRHTRPGNSDKHPGNILFEAGLVQKRRTREEKAADDKHAMEAKAAQQKAAQQGVERLALMEMEAEAKASEAKMNKAKPPPRPRARALASKSKGLAGGGSGGDGSSGADSVSNTLLSQRSLPRKSNRLRPLELLPQSCSKRQLRHVKTN